MSCPDVHGRMNSKDPLPCCMLASLRWCLNLSLRASIGQEHLKLHPPVMSKSLLRAA